jgi:hypothetical protein
VGGLEKLAGAQGFLKTGCGDGPGHKEHFFVGRLLDDDMNEQTVTRYGAWFFNTLTASRPGGGTRL